ncbi:DUF4416 family protein [Candidatus Omnitrophota bacterium]
MKKDQNIYPVKLFIGMISQDPDFFLKVEHQVRKRFGALSIETEVLPFDYTDYYNQELGSPLSRKFISFEGLIKAEALVTIKQHTMKLEKKMSKNNNRSVNIDPGYLTAAKVVLASSKNYSHRIYLGKEVFAEVTLYYHNTIFQYLPWTYPDYKTKKYIEFFTHVRTIYLGQLKHLHEQSQKINIL